MSAGAVYRFVLSRVMKLDLCDEARRDVTAVLEASKKDSLLQLLYEASFEAGHAGEWLLNRAAGAFCAFAAGNLADDLVDGDCSYLDPAIRIAPTVQWLLQNLAVTLLLEGGVSAPALRRTTELFCKAAGPQQKEVRTTAWDAARFIEVGEAIIGARWQAYLTALWAGTPLAAEAERLGGALGFCGHVALDIRTLDERFHSMSIEDRETVLAHAVKHLQTIEASPTRVASLVVGSVRPALKTAAVAGYYDEKTTRLLRRYGPGPRVHYHTGLYEEAHPAGGLDPNELKRRLVAAQEALLYDSLEAWALTGRLAGKRVLDCGCGLGGTSLLLASGGANVTALTNCPRHVPLVTDLALQAKLAPLVDAQYGAVEDFVAVEKYDIAIAVEASCYFDRVEFFRRMKSALTGDGAIHIVDMFTSDRAVKSRFDAAWRADVESVDVYDDAAFAAGFERTELADLSPRSLRFWDLTRADSERELKACVDQKERTRLEASLEEHAFLKAALADGSLRHLRLTYRRREGSAELTRAAGTRELKTALIVEDDPALSAALVRFCRARGIEAFAACTLHQAELVIAEGFDLAIVDVKLPDGSGVELCERLAARTPKPIVIAMSGAATGDEGFALCRAGVGEYLRKPFDETDLWLAIDKNAGVALDTVAPRLVGNMPLKDAQGALRRQMVKEALARTASITDAAKLLGVTRQAIQQARNQLDDDGES